MNKSWAGAALGAFAVVAVAICAQASRNSERSLAPWHDLSEDESQPSKFEPFLVKHPRDLARRVAALIWYARRNPDIAKLEEHTMHLITHHPDCMWIKFENTTAIYRDPSYGKRIASALEARMRDSQPDAASFYNLASIYRQIAMFSRSGDESDDQGFLQYFGLPSNAVMPEKPDLKLAEKAVEYYRLAVSHVATDSGYAGIYLGGLVKLLSSLERYSEAVEAFESSQPLPVGPSNAGLFLDYGLALYRSGNQISAIRTLQEVRGIDNEGDGKPGHATMRAETALGLIAMRGGNIPEAERYLMSSLDVERCPHNVTQGVPTRLGRKLLEAGNNGIVIEFCHAALAKFNSDDSGIKQLLVEAQI